MVKKPLLEQHELYRILTEQSFAGIYVVQGGRFRYLNKNAASYAGYEPEDLVGRPPADIVHPGDRENARRDARAMLLGTKTSPSEFRILTKDGGVRWIMEMIVSITWEGKPAILGNSMDITERKRIERTLRESEERFRTLIETTRDLVFIVDEKGRFNYANPRFKEILGYDPRDLMGNVFTSIVAPEAIESVVDHFKAGIKGEEVPAYEALLRHRDGKRIPVEFAAATMRDDEGKIVGRFGIGRDITERKRAEEATIESYKRLSDIINFLPDATFAIDAEGRVVAWNLAIEQMTGIKKQDMIGKGDHEYALPFYGMQRPILIDLAIKPEKDIEEMYSFLSRDRNGVIAESVSRHLIPGQEVFLWIKAGPIRDASGRIIGSIETIRDITERKKLEQTLSENERKYRLLTEGMTDMVWTLDMDLTTTYVSPSIIKILGYTPEERVGQRASDVMTPESYSRTLHTFTEEMEKESQGKSDPDRTLTIENEYYHKNGHTVWVENVIRGIRDHAGTLVGIHGVSRDITGRKRTEESLRQSEERYRTIIENIADGYYEVDLKGNVTFLNDAALRIINLPRSELQGLHFKTFVAGEDAVMIFGVFHEVYLTGTPFRGLSWRVVRPDGKEQHLEISVSLIRDAAARPSGFRGIMHDITDRRKAEKEMQHMAYHDPLTGLPNRLLFYDRFSQILAHARRNQEQFAVIMLDLDKFKEINDRLGHEAGDQLLRGVAERLRSQMRDGDTVARFGGDEFLLLLPGMKQIEDLESLGQKILQAFQQPFAFSGHELSIRASIGIAVFPDDGVDREALVQKADFAMYRAKSVGGNRWTR